MRNSNVSKIVQGALMVALASVLAMVKFMELPYGGSITLASSAPILLFAMLYPGKWGLMGGFAFSLVQMLQFYAPPVQTFWNFVLVVLLDYVLAFTVLGCAGFIFQRFKNPSLGAGVATVVCLTGRFFCHFISGILIWGSFAPEGMPVWLYSLGYNGFVCLGESIVTGIVMSLLLWKLPVNRIRGISSVSTQ